MAAHTSEDGSSSEERGWQLASAWMVAARERRLTHTDYLLETLSDNDGSDTIEALALCSLLMLTKSPFQVYEHPTDGNAGFRKYVYQGV